MALGMAPSWGLDIKNVVWGDTLRKAVNFLTSNKNLLDQLISDYENNNMAEIENVFNSNPLLSASAAQLRKDRDAMSKIKARQAEIESKLNNAINDLNSKVNSANLIESAKDQVLQTNFKKSQEIAELKNQHAALLKDAQLINDRAKERAKADLQPKFSAQQLGQNINGGIK